MRYIAKLLCTSFAATFVVRVLTIVHMSGFDNSLVNGGKPKPEDFCIFTAAATFLICIGSGLPNQWYAAFTAVPVSSLTRPASLYCKEHVCVFMYKYIYIYLLYLYYTQVPVAARSKA